jgi:hypothetical protein
LLILKKIKERIKKVKERIRKFFGIRLIKSIRDLIIFQQNAELKHKHPNPLNSYGKKCFSQNDEDGITLEIIKRIGIKKGVFAEFGPGNGLENNTIILASLKWKGFWVGSEDIKFKYNNSKNFQFIKSWITKENVLKFYNDSIKNLNEKKTDVLSLDLDGNDIYVLEELLKQIHHPSLIIAEYNAKFPPPIRFKIKYDAQFVWRADDYFGASLSEFVHILKKYAYKLVCCNSHTGSNAFFIKNDFFDLFKDVPQEIEKIYVEPRYQLYERYGHPQSIKTIELIFEELEKSN